ncbi:MAG TPA: hypothetical protein IGS52_06775 [Oscillatoriaceae cyanobacterium M33_DOE_052]|uniref:Uncharacterized protein n=1 Tax=Planktothricoides sp. SpSt-374 TaxID=2282167 RepID=A0A7C3ZZC2_9CYAN|nr:hypothetical protein [Oscillatoriaceae cyanobacterium M33_DOE_052]
MKNITLTLYAFHLKQGLGDSPETTKNQGVKLWESLVKLSNVYPFPELQNLKSQLVSYTADPQGNYQYQPEKEETITGECLTPQQEVITLSQIPTSQGFKLTGEIEPYLLNDTYCLTLTLNPENTDTELDLSALTAFHSDQLITGVTADLGKVLVFYGEQNYLLKSPNRKEAKEWATALCANTNLNPEFRGEFTLFNCPGFWFDASGLTLWILLAKPNQFEGKKFSENAPMFRGLLWSYSKINSTYRDAQAAYKNGKTYYNKLEKKMEDFSRIYQKTSSQKNSSQRLKHLDTMIESVPQDLLYYHCCLRDIKAHYTTIKTNIQNFQTALGHLIAAGNKLDVWSNLAEKTYPRYLQQVERYLEYLEPGKDLFSELINTIRATAEIEQAKSNQKLQDQIQSVGVGIAAGAIVASTSGLITQPWGLPNGQKIDPPFMLPHPFLIALFASVFCSVGAWWLATKEIQKRRK